MNETNLQNPKKPGRPPKYLIEHLDIIQIDLQAIKTALGGYDGKLGLIKQVDNNTKSINRLTLAIAVIVASTGGGAYAVIKLLLSGWNALLFTAALIWA